MLLVGLTGSIGVGKSTTADMFKDFDFGIYNADETVHYIYDNDHGAINQIEAKFPGAKENNKINRVVLRNILGKNPTLFRDLESIIHPVTRRYQIIYIQKLIKENKYGCILDIPLLFETGGDRYVDASVVVTASEIKQKERVVTERNVPLEVFNVIKNQQMPDRDKLKKADFIISTEINLETTKIEVGKVVDKLKLLKPKAWEEFYSNNK